MIIYLLYDLALASSINGLDSSLGRKRWRRQTIPRRKATVSLDNKTLKRSLAVHFQSYPLALAEKKQLATASAVFGNYDSTQSATPIPVMRNAESIPRKAEPIRQNIRFRNTKCIQSDRSILGLSVQGLVSHIIIILIA